MSLVIWTNAEFPPAETALLEAGVAPHRLVCARTTSAAVLALAASNCELISEICCCSSDEVAPTCGIL